jgi:phosphoglycolate phosphatase
MIPSAILFDLDGTLLDSESTIIQSWKTAHDQICSFVEWNEEKLLSMMGQPAEDIPKGMGVPDDLHEDYIRIFDKLLENIEFPLFEDVTLVLESVREKNIPLCIVTGAKAGEAHDLLAQKEISHFFTEIIGADSTEKGKPYPDPIILALEKLHLSSNKKNVLFVGDSNNDLLSAQAAGVTPVLLWRKDYKVPNSLKQNVEIIIPGLMTLLDMIE